LVEAETITYFELEDHKIKLESETQDMLEQLEMKEIKEQAGAELCQAKHSLS